MYGLLSKLMISGKLKFKEGEIDVFDEPFAFVHMASIMQMTKDVMEKYQKGDKQPLQDLYFYGWVYGFVTTLAMIKKFKLKIFEERYKVSMDIAALCGFGDYKTLSFIRGHAHFKVIKNPFALLFHPCNDLVDHYLRGMNAGGGTLVHEQIINCIEFECAAKNGSYCIFDNVNKSEMDKFDKNLVESQVDYDYLLKRQRILIEQCKEDPAKFGI